MILPHHSHGGSCENACCLRIEGLSVRAGNDRILGMLRNPLLDNGFLFRRKLSQIIVDNSVRVHLNDG